MPKYREPTNIDIAYHQIENALEHAAHAWRKLEVAGRVPSLESWPPSTDDTIPMSAEYHLAAVLWSIKQAHDALTPEIEQLDAARPETDEEVRASIHDLNESVLDQWKKKR